jgi:hypothetical protein
MQVLDEIDTILERLFVALYPIEFSFEQGIAVHSG